MFLSVLKKIKRPLTELVPPGAVPYRNNHQFCSFHALCIISFSNQQTVKYTAPSAADNIELQATMRSPKGHTFKKKFLAYAENHSPQTTMGELDR